MADPEHDGDLEDAQAVIALLKEHAEELRRKGVPVEAMIRALSRLHVLNLPGDPAGLEMLPPDEDGATSPAVRLMDARASRTPLPWALMRGYRVTWRGVRDADAPPRGKPETEFDRLQRATTMGLPGFASRIAFDTPSAQGSLWPGRIVSAGTSSSRAWDDNARPVSRFRARGMT